MAIRPLTLHTQRPPSSDTVVTTPGPSALSQKPLSTGLPPCARQETQTTSGPAATHLCSYCWTVRYLAPLVHALKCGQRRAEALRRSTPSDELLERARRDAQPLCSPATTSVRRANLLLTTPGDRSGVGCWCTYIFPPHSFPEQQYQLEGSEKTGWAATG